MAANKYVNCTFINLCETGHGFISVGVPVEMKNTYVSSYNTNIALIGGAGSRINNTISEGQGDQSIGFHVQDAPNTNLDDTISINNRIGYLVRKSENFSAERAVAERRKQSRSDKLSNLEKLYHSVRIPETIFPLGSPKK